MVSIRKSLKRTWDSFSNDPKEIFQEGMGAGFLHEYDEAVELFDRVDYLVIGVDDTKKDAWFYKAIALGELGRNEEAITVYKKLLEWDKKDATIWNNLG